MVLQAIKEIFRCADAFLLRTGRFFFVFLKNRDRLSTKQTKFTKTRDTVWHENFAVLIFAIFPAIRKKFNAKLLFSQKFPTQKYSTKGDFIWRWGTPSRRSNPLRWGKKLTLLYMQSYNPSSRGALSQDYWMVAKHIDKKNAGKPRVLAATFSAVAFYCYL